jgi:hypothetical protein
MENTQDQQSSLERPRFRSDLVAQPLEEEGVRYVDVTDPASSQTFRSYDVEYSIACAMDGARDLDNLAEWTRVELGIEASAEELSSVINTLAELGYLEGIESNGQSSIPEAVSDGDTEAQLPVDGDTGSSFTDESREAGPGPAPSPTTPTLPTLYDEPFQTPTPREAVPEPVPHPNVAAVEHARETILELEAVEPIDHEYGHEHGHDYRHDESDGLAHATSPASPPSMGEMPPAADPDKPRDRQAETSFAGLLDDSPPTPPPPDPAELPRGLAARSPRPAGPGHMDDEDPTQVPSAHVDEDEDDVSVDLSAHLALDKHEVQEAVRNSRVHAVPPLPSDLSASASESSRAIREATSSSTTSSPPASSLGIAPSPEPSGETKPAEPIASTPPWVERAVTQPQAEEPKVAPATPLPARPPASQPPRVYASRPIEPTKMPPPARAPAQKKSSAFGAVIIVLAIAALLVGLTYAFRERIFGSDDYSSRPQTQAPTPDKPAETAPPAPGEPAAGATGTAANPTKPTDTATPPSDKPAEPAKPAAESMPSATVRSESAPVADKVTVSASSPGQVVWVAEKGAAVEQGAPIAKLLGYAKWEARLKDAADRGGFYGKKLAEAQAKGDQAAIDAAQSKVNEKKEIADEATKALDKLVITAPSAGKVKPLVSVGADVKDGAAVAEVAGDADKPQTSLRASFDVGDGASQYAEGKPAGVAVKGAPDKQFAAVIEKIDGGKVDVKIVSAGGTAVPAPGDDIVLLPPAPKK